MANSDAPHEGGALHRDGEQIAAWARGSWWLHVTPVEVPRLPFPVFLRIEEMATGERRCAGLVIGPGAERDVTITTLRQVPIPELVAWYARYEADDDPTARYLTDDLEVPTVSTHRPTSSGRPRRARLTDEDYQQLAEEYRTVVRAGLTGPNGRPNPIQRLAKAHHLSEPTIRQRLTKARERGFLGGGLRGRAGETPQEDQ